MTDQQLKEMAGNIAEYFRRRQASRTANVPRPPILDESEPSDTSRRPGWRSLREQTEREYLDALLGKSVLTVEEQQYLSSRVAAHLRQQ